MVVEEYPSQAVSWFAVGTYYMATRQFDQARRWAPACLPACPPAWLTHSRLMPSPSSLHVHTHTYGCMSMFICVHGDTHMHAGAHTCTSCTSACRSTHMYTMHICMQEHTHVHHAVVHICTYSCRSTHTYTMHICMQEHTHVHHAHMHAGAHTCTPCTYACRSTHMYTMQPCTYASAGCISTHRVQRTASVTGCSGPHQSPTPQCGHRHRPLTAVPNQAGVHTHPTPPPSPARGTHTQSLLPPDPLVAHAQSHHDPPPSPWYTTTCYLD